MTSQVTSVLREAHPPSIQGDRHPGPRWQRQRSRARAFTPREGRKGHIERKVASRRRPGDHAGRGLGVGGSAGTGGRVDGRRRAAAATVQLGGRHCQRPGGGGGHRPLGDDACVRGGGDLRGRNRAGATAGRRTGAAHPDGRGRETTVRSLWRIYWFSGSAWVPKVPIAKPKHRSSGLVKLRLMVIKR
jgi:hypothetical protein